MPTERLRSLLRGSKVKRPVRKLPAGPDGLDELCVLLHPCRQVAASEILADAFRKSALERIEDLSRVAANFGVEFWPEEGLITHTLQTAIVDKEGKLVASVEGKDYSPKQLADLVALALGT